MPSCAPTRNTTHHMNSRILGLSGIYKWLSCNHVPLHGTQGIT